MKLRTISIGGITYDVFVRTGKDMVQQTQDDKAFVFPLGDKLRVESVIETCGGGASNTSVGLSRLNCDASFSGVIASDQWGQKLLENLQKENVDTRSATIVEDEVSSFSIILSAGDGERTILYTPGTNVHLSDALFNVEIASSANWVYLNHIQEQSCIIQDDIADILSSNETVGFTWNPGGCQLRVGITEKHNTLLLAQCDVLLLNKKECEQFTQHSDLTSSLKILTQMGVKNVCITDGSNGTIATDGKSIFTCPVADAKPKDTTGAGDAFGTGITWAIMNNKSLPEALKAGSINAASVVSSVGAQKGLLTETQMQRNLETSTLNVSQTPLV